MIDKITMDNVCLPSENIVARVIEDEMIIVPLIAGIGDVDDELYTLNETGKAIWQKLDGQKTLERIALELEKDFLCSAVEIKKDVIGFATEMVKRGILVIKD